MVGIVGEAAMTVTGMEALLAVREKLGTVYCIFNDGSYSSIPPRFDESPGDCAESVQRVWQRSGGETLSP